ncbi:MAG: hypothetical protein LBS55_00470 [Prevotellaceae bacterium]|jgi:hypothetical protein|nr:hypothetical protein [Prevotellaceae bacterium]
MKALKISLAVIVVAAIAAGVYMWIGGANPLAPLNPDENQFIKRIEQEIEQLKQKPENRFCQDFYREIAYHIDDYYRSNRFGNNQSENNQWKDIFSKKLYSAYVEKFITQAFYVFRGAEWKQESLQFIRSEYQELRRSRLLERGSPVDRKFTEIQTVFSKYDEITGFISTCNGFSYSSENLADQFPIVNVKSKISRATTYLKNRLENEYVNHCTRLHDGLQKIPQVLFSEHVRYLDSKINQWSDLYPNYNSHSDYVNNLYKLLSKEIRVLDNDIYNVPNFDHEYQRLSNKWSADNQKAYNHNYSISY